MLVEALGDVATCLIHGRWVHCCCMLVTARGRALWNFETFLDWARKGKHAAHWGCRVVSVSRAGFRFVGCRRLRLGEALLGVSYARALRAVCCALFVAVVSHVKLSPPAPPHPLVAVVVVEYTQSRSTSSRSRMLLFCARESFRLTRRGRAWRCVRGRRRERRGEKDRKTEK